MKNDQQNKQFIVSMETIQRVLDLINEGVYPSVQQKIISSTLDALLQSKQFNHTQQDNVKGSNTSKEG